MRLQYLTLTLTLTLACPAGVHADNLLRHSLQRPLDPFVAVNLAQDGTFDRGNDFRLRVRARR
jgi:hypothetical protein